jgi:hypothetical protein
LSIDEVNSLLKEIQSTLVAAVAHDVTNHVARLNAAQREFYGYAILPGDFYDIHTVVAVTNSESDIKVPISDDLYRYYRFAVDEWTNWEHNEFANVNSLLAEANKRFQLQHSRKQGSYEMDESEVAFANGMLEALTNGLDAARISGSFGDTEKFLVVWISDSAVSIASQSARRLNSGTLAAEFAAEFG